MAHVPAEKSSCTDPPDPGVWRRPLPHLSGAGDRLLCRIFTGIALTRIVAVDGLHHVRPEADPFIFACNHNQRSEALLLPTLLIFHRGGRLIHFLADWPTLLVPVASLLLRRSQVIVVAHKRARIAVLEPLRRIWAHLPPAANQALARLRSRASVGIFPEGTMNRNPKQLLHGSRGAARLSLVSGAPLIPAGISFPDHAGDGPIPDRARMRVRIGPPLCPERVSAPRPSLQQVSSLHGHLMREISHLSGKHWPHEGNEEEYP